MGSDSVARTRSGGIGHRIDRGSAGKHLRTGGQQNAKRRVASSVSENSQLDAGELRFADSPVGVHKSIRQTQSRIDALQRPMDKAASG
jgi:hypothetical protein